ncbi:sigma-70 family RNA polymerase sigma factor [Neorhizobium sp. DT-125]|uniref:sigma-70 family RNA polymerase sigma factor n=1 Tax=Neorhizobium sp. DT-125 TaxID=3396163 RepID=UPI003F1D794C
MPVRLNEWLAELFRLHHRDIVRYATRLVGDRENGEDVAQNVYVRIAGRASATAVEHPKSYVFKATRHAAIDFIVRLQAEWSRRVDFEEIAETAAGDHPETKIERRHRLAQLAVFLNELPVACRTAFMLNKVEGFTHPEIAARLGISVSMVEKHIMRAMMHCRDLMRESEAG